ncbi:hypothetical protein INN71_06485 [Nocardioides sp. ChNu-153]|uniref:alpha/beta hydrolase family protein n=1 Tax=unclassified Nocardioides TaxID=2615069 RepID=UPI0024070459|nr:MULTISPECIES: hypothetical protein [unclassified Nocardioides]MDF9715187.1 hypothetical protein [Nocardioides sp. ChNu-99]MDN7121034.1 hypothetical protein [Nocardioides sp. ChNu-153]
MSLLPAFTRSGAPRARSATRNAVRALSGAALVAATLSAGVASAAPTTAPSGDDWEVEVVPGGYEVTVDLDAPLPIVSDAPTIVVDGQSLGVATESADGLSLAAVTTDASVLRARTVEPGWASTAPTGAAGLAAEAPAATPEASALAALADDPAALGDLAWDEAVYSFGDQSVDLAAIGGIRGEMEGKLYLPEGDEARPTVVLLHGRHSYCYGTGDANPDRWPCSATQLSIPSYLGYDGTARTLASHGYAVVSISANAINANDNQLAADQGAVARGQLVLDTLDLLADASAGEPVVLHDAATDADVTLDAALDAGTAAVAERSEGFVGGYDAPDDLAASDLVGRFDLTNVGLMGHSRGGEGITSAATLNGARDEPFGFTSVLPLAPVDFGRMTVPGLAMNVVLPYCDGDVSNQQGQHMLDDSRYAFGDDALRSGTWVMGANHNFYNTVWTPGVYRYSVSDDWSGTNPASARATEPVCGTAPSTAATSIRMTAQEQYDQGTSYMAAWFRLTLGGEEQFLPMFDGTGAVPAALGAEDVRTQATAPASARSTVATFEQTSSLIRTTTGATATVCASLGGRTVGQTLPACATTAQSAQVPHWTPASNATNVPATPMTRLSWTAAGAGLRVAVPAARRDASPYERLSLKVAADETVVGGTDATLTVVDGTGARWSALVSELNPQALRRLPSSDTATSASTLGKIVLQQLAVPLGTLSAAGLDLGDLREVSLTGAPVEGGATTGGAYLSDLAFESSAVGDLGVGDLPVVEVFAPATEEGDAPGTTDVAVHLDRPATSTVTGYVSLLGSGTARAGAAMERVDFAPGETCRVVTATLNGDTTASTTASTALKASVVNTRGAVMGTDSIVFATIREDDGTVAATPTGTAVPELPPVGTSGDPCAELATLTGGELDVAASVTPGTALAVTAGGFRAGESVTVTAPGVEPVRVVADGDGVATASLAVPADTARGALALTATGAGTGRVVEGSTLVRDTTSLTAPATATGSFGTAATVVVEVGTPEGAPGATGTVEALWGTGAVATAAVVDGRATLRLPASWRPGTYRVGLRYLGDDTTTPATGGVVVTVGKARSTLLVSAWPQPIPAGRTGTLGIQVGNSSGAPYNGTAQVVYGDVRLVANVRNGLARVTLPAMPTGWYRLRVWTDANHPTIAAAGASFSVPVRR